MLYDVGRVAPLSSRCVFRLPMHIGDASDSELRVQPEPYRGTSHFRGRSSCWEKFYLKALQSHPRSHPVTASPSNTPYHKDHLSLHRQIRHHRCQV